MSKVTTDQNISMPLDYLEDMVETHQTTLNMIDQLLGATRWHPVGHCLEDLSHRLRTLDIDLVEEYVCLADLREPVRLELVAAQEMYRNAKNESVADAPNDNTANEDGTMKQIPRNMPPDELAHVASIEKLDDLTTGLDAAIEYVEDLIAIDLKHSQADEIAINNFPFRTIRENLGYIESVCDENGIDIGFYQTLPELLDPLVAEFNSKQQALNRKIVEGQRQLKMHGPDKLEL